MRHKMFFTWMLIFFTLLIALVNSTDQPPFSCDPSDPSTISYLFCKTTVPISQRARDLVCRLTLDEKISQLVNSAPPIPRLGIPGYEWWSEALHGVANVGRGIRFNGTIKAATSFPQVILTAASFDAYQWYRIGHVVGLNSKQRFLLFHFGQCLFYFIYLVFEQMKAIGKEAKAVYNTWQATGMTFWIPNINIFRDPRWGRGQETPEEHPMVIGKYMVSYVRGVQVDSFEGGKFWE